LLKGTTNSIIHWIKIKAVWGPHVRLDEVDVLFFKIVTINILLLAVCALFFAAVESQNEFSSAVLEKIERSR